MLIASIFAAMGVLALLLLVTPPRRGFRDAFAADQRAAVARWPADSTPTVSWAASRTGSGGRSTGPPPDVAALLDLLPVGAVVVEEGGTVAMANRELARRTDLGPSDFIGQPLDSLLLSKGTFASWRTVAKGATSDRSGRTADMGSVSLRGRDGSHLPATARVAETNYGGERNWLVFLTFDPPIKGAEDLSKEIEVLRQAKQELENVNRRLAHDVMHDQLTGLPNRSLFMNRLEHALHRIRRGGAGGVCVLFLDFDDFKLINDSHGHAVGDQLLVAIGRRLRAFLRPADTVARLAGDEFAVILDNIADQEAAVEITQRLMQGLSKPFQLKRLKLRVSVSIGLVCSDGRGQEPEQILRAADEAMYRAKADGKGRHHLVDEIGAG